MSDDLGEVVGCDRRIAQIVSPAPRAHVKGVFAIIGSAIFRDGGRYQISINTGESAENHLYLQSDRAVHRDVLGLINTEVFGPGARRIQLVVIDSEGELIDGANCEIPVVFGAP